MHTHAQTIVHTHTHTHTYTLAYTHSHTHTQTHPYTFVHTHTRTHTPHTHTHCFQQRVHLIVCECIPHSLYTHTCRPKSDTCKTCDSLNIQIGSEGDTTTKQQLQFDLQLHQCKAERAYHQLKEDAALSRSSSTVDTITFDLQQSLPTPKLSTSIV